MRFIENVLVVVGLLALIFGAWMVLHIVERQTATLQCDIRIQNAKGTSCYVIRERK